MVIDEVGDGVDQPRQKECRSGRDLGEPIAEKFWQKMLGYFEETTLTLQDERGRLKRSNL